MTRGKSDLLKPAAGSASLVVGPVSCKRQGVPSSRYRAVLLMSLIVALASYSREAMGCWPRHTVAGLLCLWQQIKLQWLGACLFPPCFSDCMT